MTMRIGEGRRGGGDGVWNNQERRKQGQKVVPES